MRYQNFEFTRLRDDLRKLNYRIMRSQRTGLPDYEISENWITGLRDLRNMDYRITYPPGLRIRAAHNPRPGPHLERLTRSNYSRLTHLPILPNTGSRSRNIARRRPLSRGMPQTRPGCGADLFPRASWDCGCCD